MKLTRRGALLGLAALPIATWASATAWSPAFAQSLDALRASGDVGERYDGYAVALNQSAAGEVEKINRQRRKIYEEKAAEQGVQPSQVGMVYAKQIFKKLPPGSKFMTQDGKWITK